MGKVEKITKQNVFQEAEAEVAKELTDKFKRSLKQKLHEKAKAQQLLKNIDREIKELKLEISHELGE
ncbi:hypothetical protein LCGC14_0763640 [marine sediment metagenome]|uniref:Uncharacterized protein n=1 Tax=marine sediment metagenome TaxID=412755 RepID=A0A0F9SKG3_9ZZZZ